MNTGLRVVPESPADSQPLAAAAPSPTRPLFWSVRRELWENRSIWIAPLITAGVILFGFGIAAIDFPQRRRATLLLDPALQSAHIRMPYDVAMYMIMLTVLLVWLFYCQDALYGERRDRSILFWKSLPVSDLTTVLSKATIPLVVLPLVTFVVTVATQAALLLISNLVLRMNGLSPATEAQLPLLRSWPSLLYALIAMTLWDAPFYGWLLLVSAWARRAPLLWALVPMVAIAAIEKIVFQTNYFASILEYRGVGWAASAFASQPQKYLRMIDLLSPLTPGRFLGNPDLWIGLAVAAGFLAAAVRLRRYRAPL
jgi:ABC-2 type transport system permease protein